jgi:ribonuclease R
MLPRELSEHICSLKPHQDRLAFVAKITLEPQSLQVLKEEFFEAIIHSKHRFNYDEVDAIIAQKSNNHSPRVASILAYLLPLYNITQTLRTHRLRKGFDFRSEEIRISLNKAHQLKATHIESGSPAHSLIEECMLLANIAASKRFSQEEKSIYRIHEPPQLSRIEKLLSQLATVGIMIEEYHDAPSLIRAIQKEAHALDIASEVDAMLIQSLRQASYGVENVGHFGLGFEHYTHFTSPIRRYSDLILHRLIKTQLHEDFKEADYLRRNIEPLTARVSSLEREATKAEWDFRDRKFARWAKEHQGEQFDAEVIEIGESAKGILMGEIEGVKVHLRGEGMGLFDRVRVEIGEVNIAQATIMAHILSIPNHL